MLKSNASKAFLGFSCALAIQAFWSPGSTAAPVAALPQTVTIMGHNLALKGHNYGGQNQSIAEYMPANENSNNWTVLFAVRFNPGDKLEPRDLAAATAKNIQNRKQTDPLANCGVFPSKNGKSINVDFLASTSKPQTIEHNVWRYFKSNGGVGSYQLAMRIYGNNDNKAKVHEFIKSIPGQRVNLFKELNRPDLPHWPQ